MKIFLICPVRNASKDVRIFLKAYVNKLEEQGHKVHYPPRDTNQEQNGYAICAENAKAIKNADVVHVYYDETSKGTHFDMGVAFALGKPITVVAGATVHSNTKSFPGMLYHWTHITTLISNTTTEQVPEKPEEENQLHYRV